MIELIIRLVYSATVAWCCGHLHAWLVWGYIPKKYAGMMPFPICSDVQVIIQNSYPGSSPAGSSRIRSPIRSPLPCCRCGASKDGARFFFFGDSYVYVIFDGTRRISDWARSRVLRIPEFSVASFGCLEKRSILVRNRPDGNGVGWVYLYALA